MLKTKLGIYIRIKTQFLDLHIGSVEKLQRFCIQAVGVGSFGYKTSNSRMDVCLCTAGAKKMCDATGAATCGKLHAGVPG